MAGTVILKSLFRFSVDDLPAAYAGVSVRGGTIICWDRDYDPRIVEFVDGMDPHDRKELVAAHESKGTLHLVWRYRVPRAYEPGRMVDVADDSWVVNESRSLADPFDADEIADD